MAILEKQVEPALKILRPGEIYTYEGQRFIGGTMWFVDKPEVHIYKHIISDSFQIKGLFPWAFTQSHLFMQGLKNNVREDDIVISHHVPTDFDTRQIWKKEPSQAYFVNDDAERYYQNPNTIRPKAWIYGHTHDKHHYTVGGTEFICNPVGYPGENNFLPEAAEPAVHEL